MFVEIAKRSPASRGSLISLDELEEVVKNEGERIPIYRSVYLYDNDGLEHFKQNKTVKRFEGWKGIDYVPIDIDYIHNPLLSEEAKGTETLISAQKIYQKLIDKGMNKTACCIFFSGSGFHFLLAQSIFNFNSHSGSHLPYIVKSTMTKILPEIDMSIYSRSGLFRCPASKNFKTGLYKTYLTEKEFLSHNYAEITAMSMVRDFDDYYTLPSESINRNLFERFVTFEVPKEKSFGTTVKMSNIVPCVQEMYNDHPNEGTRHNTLMRIVSHFRRHGIPLDATIAAMREWNKKGESIKDSELATSINDVYTRGYQYGCLDDVMMSHCKPNCIYFKKKDYLMDVYNVDDLQTLLNKRMEADFSGISINLSKLYGLIGIESIIYPGELVTIEAQPVRTRPP